MLLNEVESQSSPRYICVDFQVEERHWRVIGHCPVGHALELNGNLATIMDHRGVSLWN